MLTPEARCRLREMEVAEAGSADMVETAQGEIEAEHDRISKRRVSVLSYSKDTDGKVYSYQIDSSVFSWLKVRYIYSSGTGFNGRRSSNSSKNRNK